MNTLAAMAALTSSWAHLKEATMSDLERNKQNVVALYDFG